MRANDKMHFTNGELHIDGSRCSCGRTHGNPYGPVVVRPGELGRVVTAISELGPGRSVCLVADPNTYEAAGREVGRTLADHGFAVKLSMLDMPGGVKPAALASGTVMLDMLLENDRFVAVGSGTITDVTRFVAARTGKPFVSVPTAPSVDAFTSTTSPMTHHGFKSSVPGNVPEAILADVDVLAAAPAEMIAAGFGDTVGKLVARVDWQLANLVVDEYYCPEIEGTVTGLVNECASRAAEIGGRDTNAITLLTESLMISGAAMTLLDSTRPASGSEHAMSHYWEMRADNLGLPPKLHGIKVGVGSVVTSAFWARVSARLESVDPDVACGSELAGHTRDLGKRIALLTPELGPIADILIEQVCSQRTLTSEQAAERLGRYRSSWRRILEISRDVPAHGEIASQLQKAGGPAFPADIGVDSDQLRTAMYNALEVRHRYTVLNMAEELGWLDEVIDEVVQLLEK